MRSWEQALSSLLNAFRLDRIKTKVLVFALLATLLPSLTLGWQSYVLNRQFITEKISEELRNATLHTVREFNLWLRERFYEMRVFSSSYEVTENLERILEAPAGQAADPEAQGRLADYLSSVRGRFADYEALAAVGAPGETLATSTDATGVLKLPPDWLAQAKADTAIVGEPYWDESRSAGVMVIGVPIRAVDGRLLGIMAGKLNFGTVEEILTNFSLGRTGQIYLVNRSGAVIISSSSTPWGFMESRLSPETVEALFAEAGSSLEYTNHQGVPVRGGLTRVPELEWGAVAEIERAEAYAQTERIRDLTLLMVAGLLLGIGLTAYVLALTIVRPLDRLTGGATKVAAGDLDVDLPVVGHAEVGYLTQVFNRMVTRLRQGRDELAAINAALSEKNQELQELSVTDGLTGLHNRKHLMEALSTEVTRARRLKHPFSVVMIDIDHFKRYNDTYGHLAGDQQLARIAALFKAETRAIDYTARYGGEEFLLILPEVASEGGVTAADRIREKVATGTLGPEQEPVTVSVGVAAFPEHGDSAEELIASADAALYEAKGRGRNRVVLAGGGQDKA